MKHSKKLPQKTVFIQGNKEELPYFAELSVLHLSIFYIYSQAAQASVTCHCLLRGIVLPSSKNTSYC